MSARPYSRRSGLLLFVAALVLLLLFGRSIFSLLIDYKWWGEMGQVDTWRRMWLYRYVPDVLQWLILAVVLWVAHARGMKYAGAHLRASGRYFWAQGLRARLVIAARDAALRRVVRAQPDFATAPPQERAARLASLIGSSSEQAARFISAGGAMRGADFIRLANHAQRVHSALERGEK